jgi:hypothetical protein
VLRDWSKVFDAGFVYSTPPHQMTGAFWAGGKKTSPEVKKEIMTRKIENPVILINHWRWLRANGYKKEATSCKLQAASLTRKNYNVIGESRRKKLCKQKKL